MRKSKKDGQSNWKLFYSPSQTNDINTFIKDKLIKENCLSDNNDPNKTEEILKTSWSEKKKIISCLLKYRDNIIKMWVSDKEMLKFFKKFSITNEESKVFLEYFWWIKILWCLEWKLRNTDWCADDWKHILISTKFLDFIRKREIWIDDLLKTIIILKKHVIKLIGCDITSVNILMDIFDAISTMLSKEYNNTVIALLNQYTRAIDTSNIITKTDIRWTITYVNDEFVKLSWYSREELIWKPHNIVRHPEMPKETFKNLWDTIQSKKPWRWVIKNLKKDWTTYWVKANVLPILDEHNKILEYISIRTDITELKEAYKNLEEYSWALNEANMILKLNKYWEIIYANEMYLKTAWYEFNEVIWKVFNPKCTQNEYNISKWNTVCEIPRISNSIWEEIRDSLTNKKVWKWIIENRKKNSEIFWTSTHIIPILDINDKTYEFIVIKSDITEIETAQQKLQDSYEQLKELDRRKDEFLNIASHELRTPMTSIKWYISMMLDWDAWEINDEAKIFLEKVYKSSERLLDLINDMLDIAKIESWIIQFEMREIDINHFIKDVGNELQQIFKNKNQTLEIISDFSEFRYNTDENKLKQVLVNILGNASKFTNIWGKISIKSKIIWNQLEISIEDNWIWISEEDVWMIFEKFWQVKNPLTRNVNWTWLWLTISKSIIEKLWWEISVESKLWKWSIFTIQIPINSI